MHLQRFGIESANHHLNSNSVQKTNVFFLSAVAQLHLFSALTLGMEIGRKNLELLGLLSSACLQHACSL